MHCQTDGGKTSRAAQGGILQAGHGNPSAKTTEVISQLHMGRMMDRGREVGRLGDVEYRSAFLKDAFGSTDHRVT